MNLELEVDFSKEINKNEIDKLVYDGTSEEAILTSQKKFPNLDITARDIPFIPPPTNSSTDTKKELLYIKNFIEQDNPELTPPVLEKCDDDPVGFVYDYHELVLSEEIPKGDLRRRVMEDADILSLKLKLLYKRPRPHQLAFYHGVKIEYNKSIQKNTGDTPSYPSGHAVAAYFAASICSSMHPEFKSDFMSLAKIVADSRIKEGVHYPSDNEYSSLLVNEVLMPAFLERNKNNGTI